MQADAAYAELVRRAREQTLLASCAALLTWDEETYMPRGGVANRAEQLAFLAGLQHQQATEPRVGELLTAAEGSAVVADPEAPAAVNVREWRRGYDRLTRLPQALVEEIARTAAFAQQEWAAARQDSDFRRFEPWLTRIVDLKRREAECLAANSPIYDALLDEYEPGTKSEDMARLFEALQRELAPLIEAMAAARCRPHVALLRREYPIERQRLFVEEVATRVGFDFERGRLDTATHPFFIGIGPGDCRITTRYQALDFSQALFTILHEVGHALYEQGLDPEHHGMPLGEAPSLGVHEAQARLWENAVGHSQAFWEHFFPRARQLFHEALRDVTLPEFHSAVNHVEPSLMRARADEVTYNLHILVRFELERAFISGELKASDLPLAWNEAYRRYLGIEPANDAEGCLQDGHWASGLFGYFPTYTLGNLVAAQLFARASEDLGEPSEPFARGDFTGLLGWLREKVYRQGHRYPAGQLIERVTGSPLGYRPFVQGLWRKYGELYGV